MVRLRTKHDLARFEDGPDDWDVKEVLFPRDGECHCGGRTDANVMTLDHLVCGHEPVELLVKLLAVRVWDAPVSQPCHGRVSPVRAGRDSDT
jgi:hypothetical protein